MFTNKREPEPSHCATVCWADFVVLSLILLVVVYVFLGVPLTARLCKWFKRSRSGYSRPLSTSSSMHHTRRGHSMFPRRQGSDETLLEGLVDVGNDKVDDAIPLDPFLVVQPSLNNSMLVKQGLVEETVLPPPMHSAHDIQGLQSRRGETSPRKRPLSGTETAMPPPLPRSKSRATSVDTLILSPTEARTFDKKVKEVLDAERGAVVVPLPPPAYTPYPPVGQGRRGSVV